MNENKKNYLSLAIAFLLGGILAFAFCWFNPRVENVPVVEYKTVTEKEVVYQPFKVTDTVYIGQTISGQEKTPDNDADVVIRDVQANTAKISATDTSGKVWGTWYIQPTVKKDEPYFENNQVKLGTTIDSEVKIDIDPFVQYAINKERKKNTVLAGQLGSTSFVGYGREIKRNVKLSVLGGYDWSEKRKEAGTALLFEF